MSNLSADECRKVLVQRMKEIHARTGIPYSRILFYARTLINEDHQAQDLVCKVYFPLITLLAHIYNTRNSVRYLISYGLTKFCRFRKKITDGRFAIPPQ